MKYIRTKYILVALAAGLIELFVFEANALPITWVIGLLCVGCSFVAQMIRAVVGAPVLASPRAWNTSYAGGAAKNNNTFRSASNGHDGISPFINENDPFCEFV